MAEAISLSSLEAPDCVTLIFSGGSSQAATVLFSVAVRNAWSVLPNASALPSAPALSLAIWTPPCSRIIAVWMALWAVVPA